MDTPLREASPETDVAAAMGFGSFGAKPHLNKKRKIEPSSIAGGCSNSLSLGLRKDGNASDADQLLSQAYKTIPGHRPQQDTSIGQYSSKAAVCQSSLSETAQSMPGLVNQNVGGIDQARGREAGKLPNGQWDWNALRRGVRDEHGDTAYYNASFVEDPWAALKSKG